MGYIPHISCLAGILIFGLSATAIHASSPLPPGVFSELQIIHSDTFGKHLLPGEAQSQKILLKVEGFSAYPQSDSYTVLLSEVDGSDNLVLPIVVGQCEAMGMSRKMSDMDFPRPLTHDLFANMITDSDSRLLEIIITDLKDGTFYANMVFESGDRVWELDARPSDAINIAIRLDVPIYSYRHVIELAGQPLDE